MLSIAQLKERLVLALFVLFFASPQLKSCFSEDAADSMAETLGNSYANPNLPTEYWVGSSRAANQFFFGKQFLLEAGETGEHLRLAQRIRIKYGIESIGDTTLIYDPNTDILEVSTRFTYKDRKGELRKARVSGKGLGSGSWEQLTDVTIITVPGA